MKVSKRYVVGKTRVYCRMCPRISRLKTDQSYISIVSSSASGQTTICLCEDCASKFLNMLKDVIEE